MSAESLTWAWQQTGLTPTERCVLLAICDVVNAEHGFQYWNGEDITASKVELSERQLRRIIDQLEDKGLLTVDRRGARRTNLITVHVRPDKSGNSDRTKVVTEIPEMSGLNRTKTTQQITQRETPPLSAMDELVDIFGEPTNKGTWPRYQRIVNLAKGHPPGEITRRAQRHTAGLDFALTVGSLEKRWDELGGQAAELNTLTIRQRKDMLARVREREQLRTALGET